MYVSTYDPIFRKAFEGACAGFDETAQAVLSDKFAKCMREALYELQGDIENNMASNMEDELCRRAASVAEQMIQAALAGDDKTIRNLFGFYDGYHSEVYPSDLLRYNLPQQWRLVNAIVVANPTLFQDERFRQQESTIESLRAEVAKLRVRLAEQGADR